MLEERLEAIFRVGHVVQDIGNDMPPALDLARFRSAPSKTAVGHLFLFESLKETGFDGVGIIAGAAALSYLGID